MRAGWDGVTPAGYLETYRHLATFTASCGLLPADRTVKLIGEAERRRRAAESVLDRARDFRAGLYDVVIVGGGVVPSAAVQQELRAAASLMTLRPAGDRYTWEPNQRAGIATPLLAVAWSAADLLTTTDLSTVRACPGAGCGWLFLDPRGRRRWCSMAACGNRAKARRFADRHKA